VTTTPEEIKAVTAGETTPFPPEQIKAAVESIIYAADEPATLDQIAHALGVEKTVARAALDLLVASYQTEERGIEVRKVAGGWKFYTYRTSKQFMMRFGLSDLDELPSLKEFEQLAQAALGSDSGIAPSEPGEDVGGNPESPEASAIRESGENNDLAELADDAPESPEQTRTAAAGGADPT
jgi:hypothetical protein